MKEILEIFHKKNTKETQNEFSHGLDQETIHRATTHFTETVSSADYLAVKKFIERYVLKEKTDYTFINTKESMDPLRKFLEQKAQRLMPGATAEGILEQLQKADLFSEPLKEKKKKVIEEVSNQISLDGLTLQEFDEQKQKILESHMLVDEIFTNQEERDELYESTSDLEHPSAGEGFAYYEDFIQEDDPRYTTEKVTEDFNPHNVKSLMSILKNRGSESLVEEYKNAPQKFNALKQMVYQCRKLAKFAEDVENPVFRRYTAFVNSLKELSWQNTEIKQILETKGDDPVSQRFDELIKKYSENNLNH